MGMMAPRIVSFREIIGSLPLAGIGGYSPDVIVAVGNGGIPPAALVSALLAIPVLVLPAKLYNDEKPARKIYEKPRVGAKSLPELSGRRILLVDDVLNTGETLKEAKKAVLKNGAKEAKSLAVFGKADFSCFKFEKCISFPWEQE